jgi:biopolymer transport protein TolR
MAFGRLSSRPAEAPMSEINVTPLVDVMLVLLVIFILTAPLMTSAIRLDLPQSESAEPGAAPQAMVLAVNAQELELRADASVPYGRVVEAMGLAQKAGLSRIGFVAEVVSP